MLLGCRGEIAKTTSPTLTSLRVLHLLAEVVSERSLLHFSCFLVYLDQKAQKTLKMEQRALFITSVMCRVIAGGERSMKSKRCKEAFLCQLHHCRSIT